MRSEKNKKKGLKLTKEEKAAKKSASANASGTDMAVADGAAPKKKYKLNKKKFLIFLLAAILMCILIVGIYVGVVIAKAPKIDTDDIYTILTQSSVLYDDDGEEIESIYSSENRTNVSYDKLPKNLVNAFVALEDKTFWNHHGFNFIRMAGAVKDKILHGGSVSGTSTITQQLARNLFLKERMSEHSIQRKIIEAYYTVILESKLSKEEIMEAYLNTISLGYNTNGVQAASQAYFSKDVEDLTLEQCAALASLPQAPTSYALVQLVDNSSVAKSDDNILKRTSNGTYIANDTGKDRRETCLDLMLEQELITQDEYDKAIKVSLKKMLKPQYNNESTKASYFTDYVIEQVIEDYQEKYDCDYDTAWDKIYNGGLKIYTTLDSKAQDVIETEFDDDSNFPTPVNIKYDGSGNILNDSGQIVLYDFEDYFNDDGEFTLGAKDVTINDDGSLLIKSDKNLNIYKTEVNGATDYSIEFKDFYVFEDSHLYSINGGFINIPQQYKTADDDNNVTISADFFKDENYKDYLKINDDGTVTITNKAYTLNQQVIQPQAAMTIVDNETGQIKAMVGGRKTTGKQLYNRAINPRQPGSSIKPLAVYSAALQQSAEEASAGNKHSYTDYGIDEQGTNLWGDYLTASSIVIDEKTVIEGRTWPTNAGGGYSGVQTMRTALQQSINTCAVKIFLQVGTNYSADLVEKYGITTLDRDGSTNDLNPAALALGGMSNGVTTLEMASAYTVYPNNGTRKETTAYTKVEDSKGENILSKEEGKESEVLDSGVAWIMADMLKSVVSSGIGSPASISGVQVGGKTGTTSDNYDIWFDGFSASYSASLWMGNDINIKLSSMSGYAASLWGKIMNQIPGAKEGSYKSAPSNVVKKNGEYYVDGTQTGLVSAKGLTKKVTICTDSGYLATPDCPHTKSQEYNTYGDDADKVPKYYCNQHNSDPDKYPIDPKKTLVVDEGNSTEPKKPDNEDETDSNTNNGNGNSSGSGSGNGNSNGNGTTTDDSTSSEGQDSLTGN